MKKTKLFLLSGFLGSGKTSLLKTLISDSLKKTEQIAVLMNEAGSLNFDSEQLPSHIPKRDILNGCMCCSVQGLVAPTLLALLQERFFDVIFIEASGLAIP
nr:GTP-binding protein [Bacillus solitudinis]